MVARADYRLLEDVERQAALATKDPLLRRVKNNMPFFVSFTLTLTVTVTL